MLSVNLVYVLCRLVLRETPLRQSQGHSSSSGSVCDLNPGMILTFKMLSRCTLMGPFFSQVPVGFINTSCFKHQQQLVLITLLMLY